MWESDDKQFLKKIQNGDETAYKELVDTIGQSLYNTAFKILGNYEDAQDIVVETYRELVIKSKLINHPKALRSWLFSTVHNKALNLLRINKQSRSMLDYKLENVLNSDAAHNLEMDEKYFIAECLRQLPDDQREILILKSDGLATRVVAEMTGKSVAQVKLLYKKAKKFFIEYFENEF